MKRRPKNFLCAIAVLFGGLVACSSPTSSEKGGLDCPECTVGKSSAFAGKSSSSAVVLDFGVIGAGLGTIIGMAVLRKAV